MASSTRTTARRLSTHAEACVSEAHVYGFRRKG